MLFQQLNRSDAEKVFIICRNTSGATREANEPLYFETTEVTDGNAVSEMQGGGNFLLAGINDAQMLDDAYGLVQCYGYRTSALVRAVLSAYDLAIGDPLVGTLSSGYLAFGSFLSTPILTDYDNQVFSMETIAAIAAGSTTTVNARVLIKCM